MHEILSFLQSSPTAFALCMGVLGLIIGSFLNVVIHRLPKMMEREWRTQCEELAGTAPAKDTAERYNLMHPRSRCPHCGHAIAAWENIPVLSYLIQRGRCTGCSQRISLRYPVVELATAALLMTVAWHYGFGWQAFGAAVLSCALLAVSVIDIDQQLLPDSITLPVLWLGIALNLFGTYTSLHNSVIGAMAGYLSLWLVYMAFKLATGKEGMGYGDFKLLALLGAWAGWQILPVVIILSSLVGAVVGIALIVVKSHDRSVPIPFGPYLACAGWIALLWGNSITHVYLQWARPG